MFLVNLFSPKEILKVQKAYMKGYNKSFKILRILVSFICNACINHKITKENNLNLKKRAMLLNL